MLCLHHAKIPKGASFVRRSQLGLVRVGFRAGVATACVVQVNVCFNFRAHHQKHATMGSELFGPAFFCAEDGSKKIMENSRMGRGTLVAFSLKIQVGWAGLGGGEIQVFPPLLTWRPCRGATLQQARHGNFNFLHVPYQSKSHWLNTKLYPKQVVGSCHATYKCRSSFVLASQPVLFQNQSTVHRSDPSQTTLFLAPQAGLGNLVQSAARFNHIAKVPAGCSADTQVERGRQRSRFRIQDSGFHQPARVPPRLAVPPRSRAFCGEFKGNVEGSLCRSSFLSTIPRSAPSTTNYRIQHPRLLRKPTAWSI